MFVTRYYKNASDDILRIDEITFESTSNSLNIPHQQQTWKRKVNTNLVLEALDRTVATVVIQTDANEYPFDVSGGNNYEWVAWNSPKFPAFRCNMSDLPIIGEDV